MCIKVFIINKCLSYFLKASKYSGEKFLQMGKRSLRKEPMKIDNRLTGTKIIK